MLHSELKVGMLVKANKRSNSEYCVTNEEYGCVGTVVEILTDGEFRLRITQHETDCEVGDIYRVDCDYFDIYEEGKVENKMKIELKETSKDLEFGVGDVLVYQNGACVLVVNDSDLDDYRGVILGDNYVTSYRSSLKGILEEIEDEEDFGELVRVIKAHNLKLTEI